jgi:hypothetical protein
MGSEDRKIGFEMDFVLFSEDRCNKVGKKSALMCEMVVFIHYTCIVHISGPHPAFISHATGF